MMPRGLDYFEHEGFKKAQAYPKDMASISKAAHAQKKQAYGIKKYVRFSNRAFSQCFFVLHKKSYFQLF